MASKSKTQLNEKDSLMDVLNLEKQTVKMYSTSLTEGDSKAFRQTVKSLFTESVQDQYEVFKKMKDLGYCKLEQAQDKQVEQLKTDCKKKASGFNN